MKKTSTGSVNVLITRFHPTEAKNIALAIEKSLTEWFSLGVSPLIDGHEIWIRDLKSTKEEYEHIKSGLYRDLKPFHDITITINFNESY